MNAGFVLADSIYYKIELSKNSNDIEIEKLEIKVMNYTKDTLLFIPEFIIEGINDKGIFINTRSYMYSHNLLYFIPGKMNLLFSGLIIQNFDEFPQMITILPESNLLITFNTENIKTVKSDPLNFKIFSKLRVAKKEVFDLLLKTEFGEVENLPYDSKIMLDTLRINPDLNSSENSEPYDLKNPNKIIQILDKSFNILLREIID